MTISAASCEIQTDINLSQNFGSAAPRPETIGYVTAFEPGAKIVRNGQEIHLCNNPGQGIGAELYKGDQVVTGTGPMAVIYTNNAPATFGPNITAELGMQAVDRMNRFATSTNVSAVTDDSPGIKIRNDTNLAVTG